MTWKYVAGDNYDLDQLRGFRQFFRKDLISAIAEVIKVEKYAKYGLPNWRTVILRRQMGVEEAEANLKTINKVIEVIEREER